MTSLNQAFMTFDELNKDNIDDNNGVEFDDNFEENTTSFKMTNDQNNVDFVEKYDENEEHFYDFGKAPSMLSQNVKNGRINLGNQDNRGNRNGFTKQFETGGNMNDDENFSYNIGLLSGNKESTPLSNLFFSKMNVQALQNGMKYLVYKKSGGTHRIGDQSVNHLIVLMQAIFSAHSENRPYDIVPQVRFLNSKILDYAVPEILRELDMNDKYLQDIQTLPVPLDRSVNVSSKGEKALEFNPFF
jgi:hypothetical protein